MTAWSAIAAATVDEHQRLRHALTDCAPAQSAQLIQLLRAGAETDFGRQFGFAETTDPDAYRQAVPLCRYEDLAASVRTDSAAALFAEPVVLFEETSGSSGAAKLIPYSHRSLRGFQRALYPWLHDLAIRFPGLGRGYLAISPVARTARTTANGGLIGSQSDLQYFGDALAGPMAAISVMPEAISEITDITQWQFLTLLTLLRASDLTFLSVWSPTFLTVLLAALPDHAEDLLRALHDGLPPPLTGWTPIEPDPARATLVARAIADDQPDTAALWPQLQLISAWTNASAARFIPRLRQLFPDAVIQGKGLLSTEGAVSLPLCDVDYPVLAVNSGFFEFLDADEVSHLAHETTVGADYEVVISVPGFYRYRNGDRVRVRGWAGNTPQLEFIGRGELVSDLVGEKLNEAFVGSCLNDIPGFAMLAPSLEPTAHYQLFTEDDVAVSLKTIEARLQANPQYAYARQLGQLGPLSWVRMHQPMQRCQAVMLAAGQRLGDIKPTALRREPDWETRMRRA